MTWFAPDALPRRLRVTAHKKQMVQAAKLFPWERVSERIVQQIMDVMVPQITNETRTSVDVDVEKTTEISQIQDMKNISESFGVAKTVQMRKARWRRTWSLRLCSGESGNASTGKTARHARRNETKRSRRNRRARCMSRQRIVRRSCWMWYSVRR